MFGNKISKMKKIIALVVILQIVLSASAFHVTIIESESYNSGHVMDNVWRGVVTSMGFTGTIVPQTTLDNNTFFATTDLLIISSGVINLPGNRIATIQAFLQTGKPAYLQTEYDYTLYTANQAYATIVNNLGASFVWGGTTAGVLAPMNELGTFATNNNAVAPLTYFWYGCYATCVSSNIEYMLEYGGQYFGFNIAPASIP
jgi:hypothetical protein